MKSLTNRKALSLLLAIVMVILMCPVAVFAAEVASTPTDIAVYQNEDGSISITSSDNAYLTALTSLELTSEAGAYDLTMSSDTYVSIMDSSVSIAQQWLIDSGITSGDFTVKLIATNYDDYLLSETISVKNDIEDVPNDTNPAIVEEDTSPSLLAALEDAPADISVTQQADGSVLITSANAEENIYWSGLLNSGTSRQQVLFGFVNSIEFNNVCNSYGIVRGTISG